MLPGLDVRWRKRVPRRRLHVVRSERRGAPDIRYYEEIGRSSFRAASDHRLAYKYDVAEIFNTLSERFQTTRRALNDLGDRLISLEPPTKIGM